MKGKRSREQERKWREEARGKERRRESHVCLLLLECVATAFRDRLMERCIAASGLTIFETERELTPLPMELYTKENGKQGRDTGRER